EQVGPRDGPVPDVPVGVRQRNRGAGHLHRVAVDGAVEVLLGIGRGHVDAAVGDVAVALGPDAARIGVDEFAVVGDPHRVPHVHVGVSGGRVGHVEVGVFLGDDVDSAAGDVARQVALAVTAREVHHHTGVGEQLRPVRRRVGQDQLLPADGEVLGGVGGAECAGAERLPGQRCVDVAAGAGRVVLAGPPVHPRAGGLV